MTLRECTKLMTPAVLALGVEFDETDFAAYHVALKDVPLPLLAVACQRATRAPRDRFEPRFPTAPKLREWAEEARQAASKALAWTPCEACETNCGWVPTGDGRVTRCSCWLAHRARIASGGLSTPLALPAAEEVQA